MNENKHKLTLEETEQLCRLYWECHLTPFEETELLYILLNSQFDTPLIKDTKDFIGVEKLIGNHAQHTSKAKPLYKNYWFFGAAAASLIGLIIISLAFFHENNITSEYSIPVVTHNYTTSNIANTNDTTTLISPITTSEIIPLQSPSNHLISENNTKNIYYKGTDNDGVTDSAQGIFMNECLGENYSSDYIDDYIVINNEKDATKELENIDLILSKIIAKGLCAQKHIPDLNSLLTILEQI